MNNHPYNYANTTVTGVPNSLTSNWNKQNGHSNTPVITDKMLTLDIHPLTNYTFGTKDAVYEQDREAENVDIEKHDSQYLKDEFKKKGMRRSVEAILLVYDHRLPHILLLQKVQTEQSNENKTPNYFTLPSGVLEPDEADAAGMRRHLKRILGKSNLRHGVKDTSDPSQRGIEEDEWIVKDTVGQWWRPNFDQHQYCYRPAHVTSPKEQRKLFLIQLPDRALFAVPRNYRLVAAPLHEIYDNRATYGPVIANVAQMISRYNLQYK